MKYLFSTTLALFMMWSVIQITPQPLQAAVSPQCPGVKDYSMVLIRCKYGKQIPRINPNDSLECECGFYDAVDEIAKLVNFAFFAALPITVVALTWAGIRILLSQDSASKLQEAKKFLTHVIVGFIIVLTAWLIIYTISKNLLKPGQGYYETFLKE
jgi:hypothetical protein